ncbi:bifunctional enoyl-CoA hydratase/phosphate acetyltransferase [Corynebacterium urogenitale]|uniref:Bifunctional enoyl-CoA hydratase/phosphate acetyltransferase n=1 Tax=Corynebacterium urogenitale TaxID=2487892 RepID=A0A5J6Z964_9CORY|nr:MaoC/PaaZ C-terminal domain-containing protein [Corynebacterium urogenitale]QFQ02223.1 bifunctional enoyl-CoA hydratase/phosphate acetyltransferase [Corynebacterium urogenitale]
MSTVTYKELSSIPVLMDEYRNAVKDILPGVGTKRSAKDNPSTAFEVKGVKIDVAHLAAYNSATGLRLSNELPLTYPYVLSFPIVMKVMTAKDFPLTAVGLVHLNNTIEQTRPLTVDNELDIAVHAENLRPHTKGVLIDFVTKVSVAGEVVWTQTSAFLAKGAKLSSSSPHKDAEPTDARLLDKAAKPEVTPTATYRVTPEDIKIYADASGDKNPIHVSNLGAKAFGFPATIAHGMWSAAAMLRGLEGQIPQAARFQVDFAKPVVLPGSVALFANNSEGTAAEGNANWDLQLRKASKLDILHATGRIEAV